MSTSIKTAHKRPLIPASPLVRASLLFVAIAFGCLTVADLEVTTADPWGEMARVGLGIITPDFFATDRLVEALINTVAFAIVGIALANVAGLGLAFLFHYRAVRVGCAFLRAVHELFWALIFLQIFGLTTITGVLAIAIPYAGVIAKVYAEILEEADKGPLKIVPAGTGGLSAFLFARVPGVWAHFKTYSLYCLECALRSSAILGFVGLPTLGFHLESAFKQGHYSEVSALLILFYVVIATVRQWARAKLAPVFILLALWALPGGVAIEWSNAARFFTQDILPLPLREAEAFDLSTLGALWAWFADLFTQQALPGIANTLILSMIALVVAGFLSLVFFPLVSPLFFSRFGRTAGHVFLVVSRSTPEYILAYILLQLWGPSMIPAVIALALHNGAIVGHLVGRYTEQLPQRQDRPAGVNLYAYDVLPRIYPQFLAFLFFRWEVILRETAILGILGIHTLGFFVDSAFADIRIDRALLLILMTAALNIGVDALSRYIRARLRLQTTPEVT